VSVAAGGGGKPAEEEGAGGGAAAAAAASRRHWYEGRSFHEVALAMYEQTGAISFAGTNARFVVVIAIAIAVVALIARRLVARWKLGTMIIFVSSSSSSSSSSSASSSSSPFSYSRVTKGCVPRSAEPF
jgi:hypothetical protein